MRTVIIDCAGVSSPDEFWERYLDATQPEGAEQFGRNFNAFWDAIARGGPGWPGEVILAFQNTEALSAVCAGEQGSLLDGLRDIAGEATSIVVELS